MLLDSGSVKIRLDLISTLKLGITEKFRVSRGEGTVPGVVYSPAVGPRNAIVDTRGFEISVAVSNHDLS